MNAAHMKAMPRRKTDTEDAEWIAELLQYGLLKASFIPSRELSQLQKGAGGANVKLASVGGDTQGKSAWRLLGRLATAGKKYYRCPISPCSPSWMISPHLWRASPHRCTGF